MIWGSLLAGLILWSIAEVIWDTDQLILGVKLPSASLADAAWTLGYVALTVGMILRVHAFRMRPTKSWQFGILAVFGALTIPTVVYLVIPVLNSAPMGLSPRKMIDVFYPVCDLVLAFMALLLMLVLESGSLSKPWGAIALACFCFTVSDLLYAFTVSRGIYQVDPAAGLNLLSYVIDIAYTVAYVVMALGLYQQANLLDAI